MRAATIFGSPLLAFAPADAPRSGFLSPINQRRLAAFKANRRAVWSLWIFLVLFVLTLFCELLANDRPIVVSYASSPVAEIVFAEEPLDEAPTAAVTDSCYRQVEFAGVLAGTDHPEQARRVIDFLLSRPFQEDVPLRMFVYPVAEDAELPPVFVRWAEDPASPFALPPERVAAEREAWVQTWNDLMLG